MRQAVLVPIGPCYGVRVRERSRRWWLLGLSSWSRWYTLCEPGSSGVVGWPLGIAEAMRDAALQDGWVPDAYDGYVLPAMGLREAEADE
jgi:hypothetical protein